MKKLNLGCGSNWKVYPDYEGLDIVDFGQTYIADVRAFLSTIAGYDYDEIMANHFLEHFNQDDVHLIISNIWRVLKLGGLFRFVVPHMKKERSWVLTHKTFWNEATIRWLEEKDVSEIYGFGKWEIIEVITNEREDIHVLLEKI